MAPPSARSLSGKEKEKGKGNRTGPPTCTEWIESAVKAGYLHIDEYGLFIAHKDWLKLKTQGWLDTNGDPIRKWKSLQWEWKKHATGWVYKEKRLRNQLIDDNLHLAAIQDELSRIADIPDSKQRIQELHQDAAHYSQTLQALAKAALPNSYATNF
jgi:hypothetical protein